MKRQILGILFITLFATAAWGQKFCTCQLERITELDSDTIIYHAALTVFPEAVVQEVYFGIVQEESTYIIQTNIGDRQYMYDEIAREVSDAWQSFGRAASLRSSLLSILSEDLFNVHCSNIYLDNKTHDFSTILTSIEEALEHDRHEHDRHEYDYMYVPFGKIHHI